MKRVIWMDDSINETITGKVEEDGSTYQIEKKGDMFFLSFIKGDHVEKIGESKHKYELISMCTHHISKGSDSPVNSSSPNYRIEDIQLEIKKLVNERNMTLIKIDNLRATREINALFGSFKDNTISQLGQEEKRVNELSKKIVDLYVENAHLHGPRIKI